MATNPNMVAIQTVTVSATSAANIEFTNITQGYTDLVIQLSARSTGNFGGNDSMSDDCYLRFNSSSSDYSARSLYGYGSGVGSSNNAAQTYLKGFYIDGSGATASTFGNTLIYIPNYTSSNNKSVSGDSVSEHNATMAYMNLMAGLWANSSAITSITLTTANGNFAQYSTATLYGVTAFVGETGGKAVGGVVTSDANYWYHTFTTSGMFIPTQSLTADYLVVAGGGGGGIGDNSNQAQGGGGGGAGGMRCTVTATGGGGSLETALSLTAQSYTVLVGAGGSSNSNGTNSVFSTITSTGGGGGRGNNTGGNTGGSGGGGGAGENNNQAGGAGTANQGYAGGNGRNNAKSGGGGGAGQAGENASGIPSNRGPDGANGCGGNGGNGVATSISGSSVTYAGGGGGGSLYVGGTGGTGGGGTGGAQSAGTSATANRGSGGGGTPYAAAGNGGNGGSGIVIVRYAK